MICRGYPKGLVAKRLGARLLGRAGTLRLPGWSVVAAAIVCLALPLEAQAYVGPGAGITAIGSLLALVAGVLFAIVGFVWFPIKRMRRRRKAKQMEEAPKT